MSRPMKSPNHTLNYFIVCNDALKLVQSNFFWIDQKLDYLMNFVEAKKLSHMGASHELTDIAFFLQLFSNQRKQKWTKKAPKTKKIIQKWIKSKQQAWHVRSVSEWRLSIMHQLRMR